MRSIRRKKGVVNLVVRLHVLMRPDTAQTSQMDPRPNLIINNHSNITIPTTYSLSDDTMPKAVKGVLVRCDESIMAIITDIDKKSQNAYILEILDRETCLITASKVNELKIHLNKVFISFISLGQTTCAETNDRNLRLPSTREKRKTLNLAPTILTSDHHALHMFPSCWCAPEI